MTIVEGLVKIVKVLELNDETKEWHAVKAIMLAVPNLQTRWKVWKCLDYLAGMVALNLCHHPETTRLPIVEEEGRTKMFPDTRYERETCSKCGMQRQVNIETLKEYDDRYTHDHKEDISHCRWELPK